MKAKMVLRRFTALFLAFAMAVSLVVSPTTMAAAPEAELLTEADLAAMESLHFYIRHWHTVDPSEYLQFQESYKDEASGCYFVIANGYIVPGLGSYLIDQYGIAHIASESRYITDCDDTSVTMTASPVSETGTFGGVSLSAGQEAVTVNDDGTFTINYDPDVHLVKAHVFYISKTKEGTGASIVNGTPTGFDDPKNEIDTVVIDGTKYYNTNAGLHTDKSVSTAGDDGRTFELELESWFADGFAPNIGMILDASGSMAFTSNTPDKMNVYEALGIKKDGDGYVYEDGSEITDPTLLSLAEKIGNLEKQQNAAEPYKYPERENLIGYYAFNKDSTNTAERTRDWLVNSVTGEVGASVVEQSAADSIDFTNVITVTDFAKESRLNFSTSYGFNIKPGAAGADELAIRLDAVPDSGSFTVSFTINKTGDVSGESSTSDVAEILYVGALNGEDNEAGFYRMFRGNEGNKSRLRATNGNSTDSPFVANVNSLFNKTDRLYVTLVFEDDTVMLYINGDPAANEVPKNGNSTTEPQELILSAYNIIFNAFADNYDNRQIYIDDIFVYNTALQADDVSKLITTIKADKTSDASVADINGRTVKAGIDWSQAFLTDDELALLLNPRYTDNSRISVSDYTYFVLDDEYAPLGYWGGKLASNGYSAVTDDGNVIGSFRNTTVATRMNGKSGWYFVSHVGGDIDTFYANENVQSAKVLYGNNSNATTVTLTDTITGADNNTGLSYTTTAVGPLLFYIDAAGDLRCFYASSATATNQKTSYVYEKSYEDPTKAEALQRALGSFVTRLFEKSATSKVSAVRFSSSDVTGKDLILLDWTDDPAEAQQTMSLKRSEGNSDGTTTGTTSAGGLTQYNYGLTGNTATLNGLDAFDEYLGNQIEDYSGPKYIILFTDGATNSDVTKTQNKAKELREKGFTIFTIMLTGGSVEYGGSDYDSAKEFLISLSGDDETAEEDRINYFYATDARELGERFPDLKTDGMNKVDLLIEIFTKDILGKITEDLTDYTVQDYIDPRFDIVDAEGNLLQLDTDGYVNGTDIKGLEDGLKINLSDEDGVKGTEAYLHYDTEKDMYYLVWENQPIPTCVVDATKLTVWNAKITIRAKEDLIGGNAILTNGNAANENYVYNNSVENPSSGTDQSTRTEGWEDDDADDGYVSKGFPRTTVNVGPMQKTDASNSEIYMGQSLSEADVVKLLIRDADGTAEYLYWEYLYRYADYYAVSAELEEDYKLPQPSIIITTADGQTITGTVTSEDIDIDLLIQVALGNLLDENGELYEYFSFADSGVAEYIKNGAKVELQLPYAYLPDTVDSIDENGTAVFDDAYNTTGGKEHKADILGYLTYSVSTLTGGDYESYPEDSVTEDTNKRGSSLNSRYSPLPTDSDTESDRIDANAKLVTERDGNDDIVYGWEKNDTTERDKKQAGADLESYPSDSMGFDHDRTTTIVSGEIIMQMVIDEELVGRLKDGETITYTVDLLRSYNGEESVPVGTFTFTYTKGDDTAVTARLTAAEGNYNYIDVYGLPLGTYTFGAGTLTSDSDIKLDISAPSFLDAAALIELLGNNTIGTVDDGKTVGDFLAVVNTEDNSITLGYKDNADGTDGIAPDGRFAGASVTISASETDAGDLVVSKTVTNKDGSALTDEQKEETFSFEVTLTCADALKPADINGAEWEWDGENEVWTWSAELILKHGESVTFADIPAGAAYLVTERELDSENYSTDNDSYSGEIEANKVARAGFINLYTLLPGTITIPVTKTVVGAEELETYSFDFTFDIAATSSHDDAPLPSSTSFTLGFSDADTGADKWTKTDSFGEITFEEAGTYYYTVTERLGTADGILYDTAAHIVAVSVVPENGRLKATITEIDGVAVSEDDAVVNFTNYYRDSAFTLYGTKIVNGPLNDRKAADGTAKNSETFDFTVSLTAPDGFDYAAAGYTAKTVDGVTVYVKNVSLTVTADNASGEYKASDVFVNDLYYLAGTYTYTVSETAGNTNGFTYDETTYTVTVTVAEQADHTFSISSEMTAVGGTNVTDADSGERILAFCNPYEPAPVTEHFGGTKLIDGRDWIADMDNGRYVFRLAGAADEDGAFPPMPDSDEIAAIFSAEKETGEFVFGDIEFDKAGTYTYTVTEVTPNADGKVPGISYSDAVYTVTVTVTDKDGQLYASVSYSKAGETADGIVFTNNYAIENNAKLDIGVIKTLTGRDWIDSDKFEFTLTLTKVDAQTAPTVKVGDKWTAVVDNGEDEGTAYPGAFSTVTLDAEGTYTFTLVEKAIDANGVKSDPVTYTIVVTVKDNKQGALVIDIVNVTSDKASGTFSKDAIPFTNTYTAAPATLSDIISITKVLEGREWKSADEFEFVITPAEDYGKAVTITDNTVTVKGSDTKNADGSITVDGGVITFNEVGEYTFTVTESEHGIVGIDPNTESYTFTVKVTDDDKVGQLTATVVGDNEFKFTNVYHSVGVWPPYITKALEGRAWKSADEFTFTLELIGMPDGVDAASVKMPADVTVSGTVGSRVNANKKFDDVVFTKPGIYTFKLSEKQPTAETGLIYDRGYYILTIDVQDDGQGSLTPNAVSRMYYENADAEGVEYEDEAYAFTNIYPATCEAELTVTKVIEGRGVQADDEFIFTLTAAEDYGNAVTFLGETDITLTAADVQADGTLFGRFGVIEFSKKGVYKFNIQEQQGADGIGMSYDTAVRTVTVNVTETVDGLSAAVVGDTNITVTNTYSASTTLSLPIEKVLSGKLWEDEIFTFTVASDSDSTDTAIAKGYIRIDADTVNVDADTASGEFKFTFKSNGSAVNSYIFTITETDTGIEGMTYAEPVKLLVTVVDDMKGNLTVTAGYSDGDATVIIGEDEDSLVFVNTYEESKPSETEPPATEPPATEPPATEPPATEPPATEPPATEPPATEPPVTEPPATEPPATEDPTIGEGDGSDNPSTGVALNVTAIMTGTAFLAVGALSLRKRKNKKDGK